ncbi:hypothetical protein CGLO_01429 [Colletotrichum gloeosporioides Cg-14]|uniref:Prion-inhibition and propagation HeLo domain-containing protein n=1 Tax=Colletotrichum gloeosporioides (strain Cg-14) TaxID=1237896 RepID=T0M419_COLGC|nr:hypothetical protein CGLO_01429 [Colletotrichum gloeosporioides Cg-14]
MVEAVGAVSGAATLFNTAVTCFDYLRLTRWGEAAGLSDANIVDDESIRFTGSFMLNEEEERRAVAIFTVICSRFDECQKACLGFRGGRREDDPKVKEVETPLSGAPWLPMNKYLHDTMRKISEGRKNKISPLRKVKFAIYDEKHLRDLLKDINDHIDTLYQIFPLSDDAETLEKQDRQTKYEMSQLLSVLESLGNAIKGRDKNDMRMTFNNDQAMVVVQGQMNGGVADQKNEIHNK